jgi:hypothetical protein
MAFMNASELPVGAKVNVKLSEVTLIRYSLNKYREFFAYQLCDHLSNDPLKGNISNCLAFRLDILAVHGN